jgi:hypothetical protein
MDIYKIPQPVPVDIQYQVKIVCNRMRELNKFNQIILEKFASRQAYANIKGHYIPILNMGITDESVNDLEKRKYYVQSYDFTMLGFLIDEDEFEVSPAITRLLQVYEVDTNKTRKQIKDNTNPKSTETNVLFVVGNNTITQLFEYNVNLNLGDTDNVDTFEVYINNNYYGNDVNQIQINYSDVLRLVVVKKDEDLESNIIFFNELL